MINSFKMARDIGAIITTEDREKDRSGTEGKVEENPGSTSAHFKRLMPIGWVYSFTVHPKPIEFITCGC
jgi:hypothetical protein